jgi:hypothetical protein
MSLRVRASTARRVREHCKSSDKYLVRYMSRVVRAWLDEHANEPVTGGPFNDFGNLDLENSEHEQMRAEASRRGIPFALLVDEIVNAALDREEATDGR